MVVSSGNGWSGGLSTDGYIECGDWIRSKTDIYCGTDLTVNGSTYLNSGNPVYFSDLIASCRSENSYLTPFIGHNIRLHSQYMNIFDLISAVGGSVRDGIGITFGFYDDSVTLRPTSTNEAYLGWNADGQRWNSIYAINGTIQTSDRKKKKSIESLSESRMIEFIQNLDPVSYQFKEGTSGRTHYGLIAQDVENVLTRMGLTSLDFAGLCKDYPRDAVNENGEVHYVADATKEPDYALRYDEFIAPIIAVEQSLLDKVDSLATENLELKERLAAIERSLGIS